MSRNGLYALIAILLMALTGIGIYVYQREQSQPGIEVRIDDQGVSIDGNG